MFLFTHSGWLTSNCWVHVNEFLNASYWSGCELSIQDTLYVSWSSKFMLFCNTVVPALYSPWREQTPRICGHVLIYGNFPNEIPCEKRQPTESGHGHPFHIIFPTWISSLSSHQHQKFFVWFGIAILSEMLASEISEGSKQNHPQSMMGEFSPLFYKIMQDLEW